MAKKTDNHEHGGNGNDHCAFCGRSQNEVELLISTENVAICSDCAMMAYEYDTAALNPK